MAIQKQPYRDINHGDFNEEWGRHEKSSEWWYATGYLFDESENMYAYQYTLNEIKLAEQEPNVLILSLTEFATQKHLYVQKPILNEDDITVDQNVIKIADDAILRKEEKCMTINANAGEFSYNLTLDNGKGAFWNCDNGVLKMGTSDCKATTLYYSYTNMPTTGTITVNGKEIKVTGKSWFDKQGGIFDVLSFSSHWEWFSLRFYDDEEIMLFAFPQNDYQDGTYITKDCKGHRLNEYKLMPLTFDTVDGYRYSTSWSLLVSGIKEENYTITPINDKQKNGGFLEVLCHIYNDKKEDVGLCYVELLPGVYNKEFVPNFDN